LAKKKNQPAAEEPEIITEQEQANPDEAIVAEAEEETDPLQKLRQEIVVAKEEAGKNWDLYLRERADL